MPDSGAYWAAQPAARVNVFALAEPCLAAGLLEDESHQDTGHPGVQLASLGVTHHVAVASSVRANQAASSYDQATFLRARPGPSVIGRLPGCFGLLSFAKVVVQAPEQQRQPSGGDEQFAVLVQGAPPADKPSDVTETLLGTCPQFRC